jgi:hypothetical protein
MLWRADWLGTAVGWRGMVLAVDAEDNGGSQADAELTGGAMEGRGGAVAWSSL